MSGAVLLTLPRLVGGRCGFGSRGGLGSIGTFRICSRDRSASSRGTGDCQYKK